MPRFVWAALPTPQSVAVVSPVLCAAVRPYIAPSQMLVHLEQVGEGPRDIVWRHAEVLRAACHSLARHLVDAERRRDRYIHALGDAAHGNPHRAIGERQRRRRQSGLLIAEKQGDLRLAEIGFKNGFGAGVERCSDQLPAFVFERSQRRFRAAMYAVFQPFVGGR